MKYLNKILYLVIPGILVGCAGKVDPTKATAFQKKTTYVLGKYAYALSDAYKNIKNKHTVKSKKSAIWGVTGWNPDDISSLDVDSLNTISYDGEPGNYAYGPQMPMDVGTCFTRYVKIAENFATPQYIMPALADLARCLDRLLGWQDPVNQMAFNWLPNEGQNMMGYMTDWRNPMQYSGFNMGGGGGILQMLLGNGL